MSARARSRGPARDPARPAVTRNLLTALAGRLTPRDRWLLAMLHEHRVLTTNQITRLAFTSPRAALARLTTLHTNRAADRFRPYATHGSSPWHWVLDEGGAAVLAAGQASTVKELGYRRDHTIAVAHSATLAHLVGVNDFFTTLAATARTTPGAALRTWWSERRCLHAWGDLARPDGYGHWEAGGRAVEFFLEHDTGSENLARVVAKLTGYQQLATTAGVNLPVLFWLPSTARETALRRLLTRDQPEHTASHPGQPRVLVATAARDDLTCGGHDPAGPVWLPAPSTGPRVRLAELAAHTAPRSGTHSGTAGPLTGGDEPAVPGRGLTSAPPPVRPPNLATAGTPVRSPARARSGRPATGDPSRKAAGP